jgi:hypothetical protein
VVHLDLLLTVGISKQGATFNYACLFLRVLTLACADGRHEQFAFQP